MLYEFQECDEDIFDLSSWNYWDQNYTFGKLWGKKHN